MDTLHETLSYINTLQYRFTDHFIDYSFAKTIFSLNEKFKKYFLILFWLSVLIGLVFAVTTLITSENCIVIINVNGKEKQHCSYSNRLFAKILR